jgi:hypothetical protein
MKETMLHNDLLWEGDHLSDIALTAIADGQHAIVPRDALAHADACESCARGLGEAALMSAATREAMARVARRTERVPFAGVAAAIALALAGALVHVDRVGEAASTAVFFLTRGLPMLVKSAMSLARSDATVVSIATCASALLLVMMGWLVARTRTRSAGSSV